jgi:hydrogenase maturation protease
MDRILVIGYGNPDRADDGVAFHIVNSLLRLLGRRELEEGATGLEDVGADIDVIFLSQLAPEILELCSEYDRIVFVDAHVGDKMADLHWEELKADDSLPALSHQIGPAMFLSLIDALHDRRPRGFLVSVRGHEFDFYRGLSPAARALVEPAVKKILELAGRPLPTSA